MNEEPEAAEDREPEHVETPEPPRQAVVATPIPYGVPRLPTNADVDAWTPAEKATVEAAGLVFVYPDWGNVPDELKNTKVLAPRPIVERFLAIVQRTGLDPLAKQIYCIPRLSKGGIEWAVQTGIDGFRVTAERTKLYQGRDPFQWMTEDGQWVDAFIPKFHGAHPLAARATVWRSDWPRPTVAIAEWEAYKQTKANGALTAMWEKQGPGQLAKCAEALALRTTFPQDLSGVYTDDETAGPQTAIDQDRADEVRTPAEEYAGLISIIETIDNLGTLHRTKRRAERDNMPPVVFAALLAREAVLRADSVDEPKPEPVKPAARVFDASAMGGTPAEPEPADEPETDDRDPEVLAHEREEVEREQASRDAASAEAYSAEQQMTEPAVDSKYPGIV